MTRKILLSFTGAALLSAFLVACSDSGTSAKDSFDASVVCPIEGVNAYGEPNRGTFTDARDGKVYKYTTIGNQMWMAENLNFEVSYSYSECDSNIETPCDGLGRYYSLYIKRTKPGFANTTEFNRDLADTICPIGWHVPTTDDWCVLYNNMGGDGGESGDRKVSLRLKSTSVFGEFPMGTDVCGFNILPRFTWSENPEPHYRFSTPTFWTSTLLDLETVYMFSVGADEVNFFEANTFFMRPLRCVRD